MKKPTDREAQTRFCPGCGSIGSIPAKFRDCCPDGSDARLIPLSLAKKCHEHFQLAIASIISRAASPLPVALPAWWDKFILNICELSDRNSPEDEPDAMIATAKEMEDCALMAMEGAAPLDTSTTAAAPTDAIPDFRGYAALGTGQYILNCSTDPAGLIISIATDAEKEGRTIGDHRDNPPGTVIQPDVIAVRLDFMTVAGLDALEAQLRMVREESFPETLASAQAVPPVAPTDASFVPGSSKDLNIIHEVVMNIGGDWPTDDSDSHTVYHVKRMARELNAKTVSKGDPTALADMRAISAYEAAIPDGRPFSLLPAKQQAMYYRIAEAVLTGYPRDRLGIGGSKGGAA